MQTSELTICNIGLFGNDIRHFCVHELDGLLEKFSNLEFPHKKDFYRQIHSGQLFLTPLLLCYK
jgi:hypothetical protein